MYENDFSVHAMKWLEVSKMLISSTVSVSSNLEEESPDSDAIQETILPAKLGHEFEPSSTELNDIDPLEDLMGKGILAIILKSN